MIIRLDVFLEGGADEIAQKRHQRLKAAEPQADGDHMTGLYGGRSQALADRHGKGIHGKPYGDTKQFPK